MNDLNINVSKDMDKCMPCAAAKFNRMEIPKFAIGRPFSVLDVVYIDVR